MLTTQARGFDVKPEPALVDAMFETHGVPGPWEVLPATGVANHIVATRDVVLRVTTDHRDGFSYARTESIAAPVDRRFSGGVATVMGRLRFRATGLGILS